jgi:acid phosphatase
MAEHWLPGAMIIARIEMVGFGNRILQEGYFMFKKQSILLATMLCLALASAALTAQQTAQQPVTQKATTEPASRMSAYAPAERIPNLDDLKAKLKHYYACTCKCGCYAKDLDHQADRAIAFLRVRATHPKTQEKLALVLDIDETTLSNYEEMANVDFAYNKAAFNAWIETAKGTAIPGTLRLFQEAQRLGVKVFFVTGRPESQRAATELNLHNQGFHDWHELILRQPEQASATAQVYKSAARAAIQSQGYNIVLNVGDQWSDLKGAPEAEFSVKYPDPFYFLK